MFTNWLTGTTGGSASGGASSNGNCNDVNSGGGNSNGAATAPNYTESTVMPPTVAAAGSVASSVMSTPPDVVLEVGPAGPASVRFVAHSIVLGMHSGYLRSAIRLDDSAAMIGADNALVLYLSNVTAEQFAPLLTYMYTGYLGLNVENIFGVLLATHVLHMSRALEICRSFLARAQTEGYLAGSGPLSVTANCSTKIIRPIPSKATVPNFGFLPLTATHQLPLPHTAIATPPSNIDAFKQLQQAYGASVALVAHNRCGNASEERPPTTIDIEIERAPSTVRNTHAAVDEDDEDVEVFIDNNTESNDVDGDLDCAISVTSHSSHRDKDVGARSSRQHLENSAEREILVTVAEPPMPFEKARAARDKEIERAERHKTKTVIGDRGNAINTTSKRERRRQTRTQYKSGSSRISGLQIAKAPIPASQLDNNESSKVIIDVASCDGPVRFRRILNTAYGHKPEDYAVMPERTQQSVSLSFHQQMAKAISQQRQLATANEESENSESSGGGGGGGGLSAGGVGKHSKSANSEIYVCVYCKHTFKSQYCYQKHAKRHLNPLSLNCAAAAAMLEVNQASAASDGDDKTAGATRSAHNGATNSGYNLTRDNSASLALPIVTNKQSANELLRREVRPLDMNVQYYPCKTCGSKFPSYYFVHKHRKMCHADEEAAAAADAANKRENSGGESKREKTSEKNVD
ncbi:uncharacterized protein [Eurosta solidaginis]|uniref:uncharacterized protein n=1 Tax=Eurosta solidaginis TaxID=178769 RepID=UPI003530C467